MNCHVPLVIFGAMSQGSGSSGLKQAGASIADTEYARFPVVIPKSLKFGTSRQALSARRVLVKTRAETQTYSSNNNRLMRILMYNNALYDTRYGYFEFRASCSATGGTYCRFAQGIFSAFDRFRVIAASSEIEDTRDWNRIYNILWQSSVPALATTNVGVESMGFGTQV